MLENIIIINFVAKSRILRSLKDYVRRLRGRTRECGEVITALAASENSVRAHIGLRDICPIRVCIS